MIRSLIFLLVLFTACGSSAEPINFAQVVSYETQQASATTEPSLAGIQGRIQSAFAQAMVSKKSDAMQEISGELETLYKNKKQNLIQYWRAYLQFYMAIFHIQAGDSDASEAAVDKGVEWMKAMKKKNSEDYALLSMLQGFSIQFKGMRAMFLAGQIKKNAETAIAIDAENIRAQYVYGSNDFYTPEKYGGGQEAEAYLLKAISLDAQKVANEYLPSWGKEEAYELLIKWYIKQDDLEKAKEQFKAANTEFPNSYMISQLAAKLI